MATITSYRDLEVWRRAMDLAEAVHRLTRAFPRAEEYRLTSQILRAAISVPANIAEGWARGSRKEYANFVAIARGSLAETETLLMLAQRMECAPRESVAPVLSLAEEVGRRLTVLRARLREAPAPNP
jgi:four helix bundle protein